MLGIIHLVQQQRKRVVSVILYRCLLRLYQQPAQILVCCEQGGKQNAPVFASNLSEVSC